MEPICFGVRYKEAAYKKSKKFYESQAKKRRRVSVDGKVYPSIAEAAKVIGCLEGSIRYRISCKVFNGVEYKFLDPPRYVKL